MAVFLPAGNGWKRSLHRTFGYLCFLETFFHKKSFRCVRTDGTDIYTWTGKHFSQLKYLFIVFILFDWLWKNYYFIFAPLSILLIICYIYYCDSNNICYTKYNLLLSMFFFLFCSTFIHITNCSLPGCVF